MSLVGFIPKNHPQQVGPRGTGRLDILHGMGEFFCAAPLDSTDEIDDRAVPEGLFRLWDGRFHFTIDVAANHHNAKCGKYCTKENSGLETEWVGERVYCNPPFSNIAPWVAKAWEESERAQLIVMLLPANRTEQKWWQEMIEPKRDKQGSALTSEFLPGRLKFISPGEDELRSNNRPPFGCLFLIWKPIT